MPQHMPVEVRYKDQELAERYSNSKRTVVVGSEKFFLDGHITLEVEVFGEEVEEGEKAVVKLDSGFTIRAPAPEAPILKNIYGSNISVEAGDEELALQMNVVIKKGSSAQVKFGNQVIADLQFT